MDGPLKWHGGKHYLAFFVKCRQSRQGLQRDFATLSRRRTRRGMNEQVSAWLTAVEGLPEVHARLKRVVILSSDAIRVIESQDGPDTLFYCDPPYLHETRAKTGEYACEILSGYPSEMYGDAAELYGWRIADFDLPNNASSKVVKERKIERVWMNFPQALDSHA